MTEIRITIRLRPEILDPEADAIAKSLGAEFPDIEQLRQAKVYDVVFALPQAAAQAAAERMAAQVLANPTMEEWVTEIIGPASGRECK